MEFSYIFSKKKDVFLIFQEKELSSLKNKKFQKGFFQARKVKKPTLKNFLIFREMELFCSQTKKLLYFFLCFRRELAKSEKKSSYIFLL